LLPVLIFFLSFHPSQELMVPDMGEIADLKDGYR